MIPDVPRRPSDGGIHAQIGELYTTVAIQRDALEYVLNVIEDRLAALEKGGCDCDGVKRAINELAAEVLKIKREMHIVEQVEAYGTFDYDDWLDDYDMLSTVSAVASGLRTENNAVFDFADWLTEVAFTSSAVGTLDE